MTFDEVSISSRLRFTSMDVNKYIYTWYIYLVYIRTAWAFMRRLNGHFIDARDVFCSSFVC